MAKNLLGVLQRGIVGRGGAFPPCGPTAKAVFIYCFDSYRPLLNFYI
jgi:hypothetical protein